jgi:oligopeptidase B
LTNTQPPIAKRLATTASHHGTTITDHYSWLKDPDYPEVNDPEVLDYLKAENEYFNQAMAPIQPLVDELFEEIKARQAPEDESVPYEKNGWHYQWRFAKDAQYRTWYRAAAADAENWQTLLDETELAQGHEYFRLGSLSVSPSGTHLAYSTDTNGSERFILTIVDIETRESLSPAIDNVSGGPEWGDDDQLYYVRLSEEWRPYQVWHHKLGNTKDRLVYEEPDSSFFVGIDLTQSEQYVLISAGGHTHNEVSFVPRVDLNAEPQIISPRRDLHEYDVDHGDGQFFIRSNREHANFDIFTVDEAAYQEQNWQTKVAGSSAIYITGHVKLKDHLIVMERHQGLDQVRIVTRQDSRLLPFDEPSYDVGLAANPNYETTTLRLSYTSMVTPNTVFDYDLLDHSRTVRKVQSIPSGYDATQFVTQRLEVTARDGASVPVSLVHHRDTQLDGSAPLYLYGYGAYGLSIPPSFSTTRISLLERGFVYAIAHIRGGDDLGYDWYTQGKLKQRTNTFNDFVDVARHLVKANYSSAGNLAIAGGSAGGELMGAALNQAPELWGAVAAHVPFVDVLNTMLDESLPLTPLEWPEWGDPIRDAEAFALIQSYSPYDQLREGVFPPIMVTAGLNDPRVTYWEPAKFVAKLRHLKQDDNLLILKTNMGAGHGGKSGRFDSLRESAEEYAFILNALHSF